MVKEIWKPIPGYEGLYEISNMGRVKSHNYRGHGKTHLMKPSKAGKYGYRQIGLRKNGKTTQKYIAVLVWTVFKGPIPKGYEVNHIDEDNGNNRLDNFNLLTKKENNNYGNHNKRVALAHINGKDSKPVKQFTLDGTFIKEYPSIHEAERQTGFNQNGICQCCRGNQHTSYGYKWQYA